jgi:amino-acid N-acetyltransferase
LKIRKARVSDAKAIHKLVNEMAKHQQMLPRALNDIYENLRDFLILEEDGQVAGACALHLLWEDLAEIRSLAVRKEFQGRGAGRTLVRKCMREAKGLGVKRVFALTYQPEFFTAMGFKALDKSMLPQKIWGDCLRCPKFPECDETAVIMEL